MEYIQVYTYTLQVLCKHLLADKVENTSLERETNCKLYIQSQTRMRIGSYAIYTKTIIYFIEVKI